MKNVGLEPAHLKRFPHEFSGGRGFFGFHEEAYVVEVRGEAEGVVCMALCDANNDRWLDLDFLFIGVLLDVMVDVPTEGDEELADEVLAGLGLRVIRSQVGVLVRLESPNEFLNRFERCFECGFHPSSTPVK